MRPAVPVLARLVLGLVFLYASLDKLRDPAAFAALIGNYRLPLGNLEPLVAVTLPGVEALAGVLLLLGVLRRGSALVLGGLSAVFAVAVASALLRGLDIQCGCFTLKAEAARAGWANVGLDLLLVVLAGLVLFERRAEASDQESAASPGGRGDAGL